MNLSKLVDFFFGDSSDRACELQNHAPVIWAPKHLIWMSPPKLGDFFYGFSYYIHSDRAGELQVHISAITQILDLD